MEVKSAMGGTVTLRVGSVNVGTMRVVRERWWRWLQVNTWIFAVFKRQVGKARGEEVGRYKFFWMGREEGYHGVGGLVAEEWIEKVLDVKRWSERIMVLRVVV